MEEFWKPLFEKQFVLEGWIGYKDPSSAKDTEGNINLILKLKPACVSGGKKGSKGYRGSSIDDYLVRSAKVISIAEMCLFHGHEFTAGEIYQYFVQCKRLCTKKDHSVTSSVRRAAVVQHHAETGRWGLGKGVDVGGVAWSGKVSTVRWWFGIPSWPSAAIQ